MNTLYKNMYGKTTILKKPMYGFKIVDMKMKSLYDSNTEWAVGKTTELGNDRPLGHCRNGLHFSPTLRDLLHFSRPENACRVLIVKAPKGTEVQLRAGSNSLQLVGKAKKHVARKLVTVYATPLRNAMDLFWLFETAKRYKLS